MHDDGRNLSLLSECDLCSMHASLYEICVIVCGDSTYHLQLNDGLYSWMYTCITLSVLCCTMIM
jgi:hypothetical protein